MTDLDKLKQLFKEFKLEPKTEIYEGNFYIKLSLGDKNVEVCGGINMVAFIFDKKGKFLKVYMEE